MFTWKNALIITQNDYYADYQYKKTKVWNIIVILKRVKNKMNKDKIIIVINGTGIGRSNGRNQKI